MIEKGKRSFESVLRILYISCPVFTTILVFPCIGGVFVFDFSGHDIFFAVILTRSVLDGVMRQYKTRWLKIDTFLAEGDVAVSDLVSLDR